MFHVGHAGCLDAKAVDDKAEGDVMPHVPPQSRRVLTMIVASDGEVFLEEFVCEDTCLWEPVNSLTNFNINPAVGFNNGCEIVFVDDFLGKDVQPKAHVFVVFHWDVQIEAGEVNPIEQCAGSRNSGVEKEFCCSKIGYQCALVPRVVNAIATHGEPSSVWFVLLRTITANNMAICIRVPFWDIQFS